MRQYGFTYLGVLFAVAILGAVLASTAVVWQVQVQRDKEKELLFIGHAYRQAIAQYYEKTPGTTKQFPQKLEDLLEDKRQTQLTRYLRRIYLDPMTASKDWGLITGPGATIVGVYSRSTREPIKTANFEEADRDFAGAVSYVDWKFTFTMPTQVAPAAPPPGANPAGQTAPPGSNPTSQPPNPLANPGGPTPTPTTTPPPPVAGPAATNPP